MNRKISVEECLKKLKELGVATALEWAKALGYHTSQHFYDKRKRVEKEFVNILHIEKRKNRYYFSIIRNKEIKT